MTFTALNIAGGARNFISQIIGSYYAFGNFPVAVPEGGATPYKNLDVDETGVNIKASAGQIYSLTVNNRSGAERFLKLYDKASAPTVGTDTPKYSIPIPTALGPQNIDIPPCGLTFALGIGIGATTGIADNNTGAPSANDVVVNLSYI